MDSKRAFTLFQNSEDSPLHPPLPSNLHNLLQGQNLSKPKDLPNNHEFVIVFSNPDQIKDQQSISLSQASEIFNSGFSNLPPNYPSSFDSILTDLPETGKGKVLSGGGKIVKQGSKFVDSGQKCSDFLTLIRNTVQVVLEVELNIKTSLYLSNDGSRVYMCLHADTQRLLHEAEETEHNLQLDLAEVDWLSLEPCDGKLRPLRYLNHGNAKVSQALKTLEGFDCFKDPGHKIYEATDVNKTHWQAYFEYVELLIEGLRAGKPYKKLAIESKEKINYKFGFKVLKNLWDHFKVSKPIAPHMDYTAAVPEAMWRKHKIDHNMNKSLLRNIDKIKLIPNFISKFVHLDYLRHKGLILDYYPLHNYWELKGSHVQMYNSVFQNYCTGKTYARIDLLQKWSLPFYTTSQPVNAIRKYFGEKIGLYFAFLGLNGKLLAFPSILGVGVFVAQRIYSPASITAVALNGFYSVYIPVLSIIMIELWKRKQSALSILWGQTDFEEDEVERPEFQGAVRRSPITDDMEELYYSKSKTRTFFFIGILITICILLLVLSALTGILIFRKMITNQLIVLNYDFAGVVCSILNAIQIQVFNFVFKIIVTKINKIENHRTLSEYENSLIIKTYLFQFVNSFSSLYYIAFVKTHWEGCLVSSDGKKKMEIGAGCMDELYTQLLSLFVILFLKNIVEVLQPWVRYKLRAGPNEKASRPDEDFVSDLDKQFFLESYDGVDSEGSLQDYMELVIMLGYTTLFAVAFPLSSFLTYVAILIEIQVDKFKLVHLVRRPNPIGGKTIGVWQSIFTFNCTAAIFTNIGIICFTIPAMSQWSLTRDNMYFTYTLSVLVLLGVQWLIQVGIPDMPKNFSNIFKRHKHIVEKKLFNKAENESISKDFNLPNFLVHASPLDVDDNNTFYN